MDSGKTAQALIAKYNYEENDMQIWLIKPSADTRDGAEILRSRIGLQARVEVMTPDMNAYEAFRSRWQKPCHVIIVGECQFMTPTQIDQLRAIVDDFVFWFAYRLPDQAVPRLYAADGTGGLH